MNLLSLGIQIKPELVLLTGPDFPFSSSPFPLLGVAVTVPYSVRLAPPFWEQKRDAFLESWEEGIRVRPVVCTRKREFDFLHSRILLKRFNRAMAEDGKPPEKPGCRRSNRLSAHSPSSSSDLGSQVASKLSPVAEMVSSSPEVFSLSVHDDAQEVSDGLAGEHGGGAMVAGDVLSEPLYTVCPLPCLLSPVDLTSKSEGRAVDGVDVGKGFELLKKPALIGGAAVGSAVIGCAFQACSSSSTELPFLADASDTIGQVVSANADGGKLIEAVASISKAGVVQPMSVFGRDGVASLIGLCGQPFSYSVMSCCPDECGSEAKESGEGLVSKEDAAPPVTGAALRPQPTDGLQQPPLALVEPALVVGQGPGVRPSNAEGPLSRVSEVVGVEGGVAGSSGMSRTYAHVVHPDVVHPDRRADVELHYLPPADGGNTVVMEETDGDKEQWGSCL
ncbi:hypothetical protein Dimus_013548, partial [Dionaea muscipula]